MREIRRYRWYIQDMEGVAEIVCDENDENSTAHALVENKVSHGMGFGFGYRHFVLLDRRPCESNASY